MAAASTISMTIDDIAAWVARTIAPDLEYLVPPDDGAVDGVEVTRSNPYVFKQFVPSAERMPAGAHHAPSIAVQLATGHDTLTRAAKTNGRELSIRLVLTIWHPGHYEDGAFVRDADGWRNLFNGLGVIVAAVEAADAIAGCAVDRNSGVDFGFYEIEKEIPDLYPYFMGTVDFRLLRAPHSNSRFDSLL